MSVQHFVLHHIPQLVEYASYTMLYTGSIVSGEPSALFVSSVQRRKDKERGKKGKMWEKNKKANTLEAAGSVLISEVNPLNSLQQAFDTF